MQISERQKSLIQLLADGEFHSGTELAEKLGVSRSAVWKQLHGLSELGLRYASISGKGYRLEKPLELLSKEQICQKVSNKTKEFISSFEIHDQINSTNSYLMEHAHNNAPSGFICMAEHQTAGKGRRGRSWISPYGHNIFLSILWRFQHYGPSALSGLSLAIGVAVIRALKQHHIHDIGLKWPNDIFSRGKKLGGILVEVSGESEGPCVAIIGLGLNLFLSEVEADNITQPWTDLVKITRLNRLPRNYLAGNLINELFAVINGYEKVGIAAYIDEWRTYDSLKKKQATLVFANQTINGIVEGVDDNGLLLIKRSDGPVQSFASGEVTFSSE